MRLVLTGAAVPYIPARGLRSSEITGGIMVLIGIHVVRTAAAGSPLSSRFNPAVEETSAVPVP